ncbi:MAG: hypothetical protein HWE27_16040 [Gammaproteobacteria bacterium]|nr:hypothetical protein [Gammaproteobacteria bacterium]
MNYRTLTSFILAMVIALPVLAEKSNENKFESVESLSDLVEQYSAHFSKPIIYPYSLKKDFIGSANLDVSKITEDDLKLLLGVNNYAVLSINDKLVITSISRLKQVSTTPKIENRENVHRFDLVTETIEMKYVSPTHLMPVLRQLLPQPAHLGQSGNSMLISGFKINVDYIKTIAASLDTEANAEALVERFSK